jgi:hypothetical protein
VTPGAIMTMGENLAALHDPKPIDWAAKYRADLSDAVPRQPPEVAAPAPTAATRPYRPSKFSPIAHGKRCAICSGPITEAEIYFSTVKLRGTFGGGPCAEGARTSTLLRWS